MKRIIFLALVCALIIAVPALAEGKLNIVATDFPCYDFARQVAGDRANVTMLLKPGTEAHAYDPTPADILALSDADLFVYIGGESDAWADNILTGFDGDGPSTLRLMDCVTPIEEEGEHAHEHDDAPEYDEHIWTSPVNAMAMIDALAGELSEIDAQNGAYYAQNADAYNAQIAEIDAEIRGIVESAPRKTLVFADRFPFAYFVREYGLDYLAAFPSCTADTEPSVQVLMTLIDRVIDEGIPAVYTIELSTQAIARTVQEETGAAILTLHSMQTVSQDEFEAGETYVSLMQKNVKALREGLR